MALVPFPEAKTMILLADIDFEFSIFKRLNLKT